MAKLVLCIGKCSTSSGGLVQRVTRLTSNMSVLNPNPNKRSDCFLQQET